MKAEFILQTGPRQGLQNGSENIARGAATGEQVCTDAHGRYYEASSRGRVFVASNVAAQAVSVALTTTYTGLCISNPLGSGRLLSMLGCNYAISVAPAGIASLHLIWGFSTTANITHGTPLASPGIQNAFLGTGGSSGSKALADSAATTIAPFYCASIVNGFTAGALPNQTPLWTDLAGLLTIPPGGWIAWGALTAVTGFGTFMWEEIDI